MNTVQENPIRVLRNTGGFLSADFLFSIVIACGLCAIFFCLTFTLSVIEVGQYIAFSVSRAHAASHKTQEDQERLAKSKFDSLKKNKVLGPLFANGWFEIGNLEVRGGGAEGKDFSDRYPGPQDPSKGVPQVGIRLSFEAKVLDIKFPLLGGTDPSGNGFKTLITGLMIREPTAKECRDQIKNDRYRAIMELDKRFEKIAGRSSERDYIPMEDNGC